MGSAHEEQFREFAAANKPAMVRTTFLLSGDRDEAHDLVQDVLMRVHRRWTSIQRTDDPGYTFISTIMHARVSHKCDQHG